MHLKHREVLRYRLFLLIHAVVLALAGTGPAQEEIGHWPGFDRCRPLQIVVRDGFAYCSCDSQGLMILDVSSPRAPVRVSGLRLPGWAYDVEVGEGVAYVATNWGLSVIDVSDPTTPSLLEQLEIGPLRQVTMSGDLLCAWAWDVMRVFDVSDPIRPLLVSEYGSGLGVSGACLFGDHAFMTRLQGDDSAPTLQIVDFSVTSAPRVIWSEELTGESLHPRSIRINEGFACISSYNQVLVLDVRIPTAPRQVARLDQLGAKFDAHIRGGHLYVACHSSGLVVYDLADPANPVYETRVEATTYTVAGTIDGSYYYALDLYDGLHVVDISNPAAAQEVAHYNEVGQTWEVELVGSHAYVADGWSGLRILDITDPRKPLELASFPVVDARAVEVVDGIAYVAGGRHGGFWVLDVNEPSNPGLLGFYQGVWFEAANDMKVRNGFAFIAKGYCTGWTGLRVMDVRNPANPVLVDSYPTNEHLLEVEAEEGTVFVPNGGEIDILGIGADGKLLPLGRTDSGSELVELCVDETTMYAVGSNLLHVFDISTPTMPVLRESHSRCWTSCDLQLHQGYLYNAPSTYRGQVSIQVFDVRGGVWSGPAGEIEADFSVSMCAAEGMLAVADRFGGVVLHRVGEEASAPRLRIRRFGHSTYLDLLDTCAGAECQVWVSENLQNWSPALVVEGTGCTVTCDVSGLCAGRASLYFQIR